MHEDWFQNENNNLYIIDGNIDMTETIYELNTYDIELLKIKTMIQTNLKTQHLKNIMLCMENILLEDIKNESSNDNSDENSLLTDENCDDLSNTKSDESSYQLSEKDNSILEDDTLIKPYPIENPKKMIHFNVGFDVNIGVFDIVVISILVALLWIQ
jgi:hypothetical protein